MLARCYEGNVPCCRTLRQCRADLPVSQRAIQAKDSAAGQRISCSDIRIRESLPDFAFDAFPNIVGGRNGLCFFWLSGDSGRLVLIGADLTNQVLKSDLKCVL